MIGHEVTSVKKQERIHIVTCKCGDTFDSIESEALARSYHFRHLRLIQRQAQR